MFRIPGNDNIYLYKHGVQILILGVVAVCLSGFTLPHFRNALFFPAWANDLANYSDASPIYRRGKCLLDTGAIAPKFDPDCIDTPVSSKAPPPLVLIWGDSYAGHLYPGLRSLQRQLPEQFLLAQLTLAGCPPMRDFSSVMHPGHRCQPGNMEIEKRIREIRPKVVIISANWMRYAISPGDAENVYASLSQTITRIRGYGIEKVVIVGQAPLWKNDLRDYVIGNSIFNKNNKTPPMRLSENMAPITPSLEQSLSDVAASAGAQYVSPISHLCNVDGCIATIRVDGQLAPFAWVFIANDGHFTDAGSRVFVEKARQELVPFVDFKVNPAVRID